MAKAGKRKVKSQKWTAREYQVLTRAARIKGIPVGTLIRSWSLRQARQFLKEYDERQRTIRAAELAAEYAEPC